MKDLTSDPFSVPFYRQGAPDHGVLLLHGFTGSPANLYPLAKELAEQGLTVHVIRLAGHGATLVQLKQSRWQDWLRDAFVSYDQLARQCARVSVVGLSMGGALALLLAEHRPVYRVVTIAAALRAKNPAAPAASLLGMLPVNPFIRWRGVLPHEPGLEPFRARYDGAYLKNIAGVNTLMRFARQNLPRVTCPLLAVRAGRDSTVRKQSAGLILRRASSTEKELLELSQSPHLCVLGPEYQRLQKEISRFLLKPSGASFSSPPL